MWKSLALLILALVALAAWLSRATAQEMPGGQTEPPAAIDLTPNEPTARVPDGEAPRHATQDFVPWIEAIILQKTDVANRRFPLRPHAQEVVNSGNSIRIFRKFPKLDGMDITLIGGRSLSDQAGVLLFTTVTEEGPVAFKIYHYKFGKDRYVGKIEITDDWDEIERLYLTVDILQTPVTVPL